MQEILIIEPGRRERHYWLALWRYRELFYVLARRDLSIRYKQTVIGVSWALIRPLVSMIVLTIIFGHIAKLPSDGTAPYALMVFAGMLPWTLFSTSLSDASNSLVSNATLPPMTAGPKPSNEFSISSFHGVLEHDAAALREHACRRRRS